MDSEDDDERELRDIDLLNAVLDAEAHSDTASQCSGYSFCSSVSSTTKPDCTKIETAIALNKITDDKLTRLEKVLVGRLKECRQKLAAIQKPEQVPEKLEQFRLFLCGKPYFKDKDGFTPPDNEDTILMAKSNMYDFSNISGVPGWTVADKSSLISVMKEMSLEIRKKNLNNQISSLKQSIIKIEDNNLIKEHEAKIDKIKKQINDLPRMSYKEMVLNIDEEYDWETVATKLDGRHNAQEYRALWKLFLHPSVNKSSWSQEEHISLQRIAGEHNFQDWDAISKALNTSRTGYQCFVYFRTNMSSTYSGCKWTKEEEEYLKRLIDYYKEDNYIPWGKVASAMDNRTKVQVYNKYIRLMELRKGRFVPEEDAVILTCLEKFGPNFSRMTKYLPCRSTIQIRTRYNVLSNRKISSVWTVEEDKRLIQLVSNQDSTTNYSAMCTHFPGKSRSNLRARALTLVKWMRNHPNADLGRAPRRGARILGHGRANQSLNEAIEGLKTRIQSEVLIKKAKHKLSKDSPESFIEDAMVATLVNEAIANDEEEVEPDNLLMLDDDMLVSTQDMNMTSLKKLLVLLKARLNKISFESSNYAKQLPQILDTAKEVSLVKVKSYSRKNTTTTIMLDGAPDIWGQNPLRSSCSVLPPNYSTITGCMKLLSHVGDLSDSDCKINPIAQSKKSPLFKKEYSRFMEYFNVVFLWPMILSNEPPKPPKNKIELPFRRESIHDKCRGVTSGIAIPALYRKTKQKSKSLRMPWNEDVEHIDLDASLQNQAVDLTLNIY